MSWWQVLFINLIKNALLNSAEKNPCGIKYPVDSLLKCMSVQKGHSLVVQYMLNTQLA